MRADRADRRRKALPAGLLVLSCVLLGVGGCAGNAEWVKVRDTPRNPLAGTLDLLSPHGPKPTERTMQLLRRYDLEDELKGDRAALLARLEDFQRREPDREHEYAMAEIAYITAKQAEQLNRRRALQFYGTALIHAYRYLFDQEEDLGRGRPGALALNPYDPQFRGASELYNQSLESMLRLVNQEGPIRPGMTRTLTTANTTCSFGVTIHSSGWRGEDIDRLEFVSDYQIQGLPNHYHTYGLGVPLIAVRRAHDGEDPATHFYPPNVCFPLTAFLRVENTSSGAGQAAGTTGQPGASALRTDPTAPHFVLELFDPLDRQAIQVADRGVPLEADLSTPLAYFLNQPQFQDLELSTTGLLRPGKAKKLQGLYMLEPFDAEKMPVVMIHGLWSSPITWMEMYNDLRSDPQVRENYQFWFYLYPTGQPFWTSATQMREDLAMMRREVDPSRGHPALDEIVLVGHSMGGLIAKLQTVESSDAFWQTMSEEPFAELKADPETARALATTFYFRPNPSVRRVITLGTPHRGSPFSNDITRWAGNKLISLPKKMMEGRDQLLAQNKHFFRANAPIQIKTSIDSLSPDSPMLSTLLAASPGPWVTYHNVIGREPKPGLGSKYIVGEGDGVVPLDSARLDESPQVESQIVVSADHSNVHRHPQSVLEVRRVLFEQLSELQNFPASYGGQVAKRAEPATTR
jgi:pimeloyl-ACP methyl ester carboxylesterase